jgi:uncharacterized protein
MASSKYTFLDFAQEVLLSASLPMTFQEIWEIGKGCGLTTKLKSNGKTPWRTLGASLYVDILSNPQTRFMKANKNPARFFLISRKNEVNLDKSVVDLRPTKNTIVGKGDNYNFHERKLHSILAYFAYTNTSFNHGKQIYTKTIFHEKSKHNSLSEWIHPDMVGFYSPVEDWNGKLFEFNKATDKTAIRLYSFELKKRIDRSNYRQFYFQSVSNSSWANEGYLVTCYVQQDDDLLSELERLSASFGIGLIVLDLDDIDSSSILFPARSKDYLDWETMNKLCEQNPDFETFIDDVQRDYAGKKIHPSEYESIISDPESYITKMRSDQG